MSPPTERTTPHGFPTPQASMSDVCCFACKGAFGICLTGYRCGHHIDARITEEADDRGRRTVRRPTEDQAIANVMREKRRR